MRLAAALQIFSQRVNELATATASCAENYRTEDDAAAARFRALGTR